MFKEKVTIKNIKELDDLSKKIATILEPNFFLLFIGKLGAGKTTFIQLIAKNLGIKETIKSPTFNIVNSYVWKTFDIKENNFNHFDFFRFGTVSQKENYKNFFPNLNSLMENSINLIEWPEYGLKYFWEEKKIIIFKIRKKETNSVRKIEIFFQPNQQEIYSIINN